MIGEINISSTLSLSSGATVPEKLTGSFSTNSSWPSDLGGDLPIEFVETDPCIFRRDAVIRCMKALPNITVRRAYATLLEVHGNELKKARQERRATGMAEGVWQENPEALRHL